MDCQHIQKSWWFSFFKDVTTWLWPLWSLVHDGQHQSPPYQRSQDSCFLGWANHEISISGRPCVHPDDDLIVSHFAIDIGSEEKMDRLIRFHLVLLQQCMALVMWRKFRVDLKPENHLRWEQFCYNGSINRRLDELGVAYRENVSVPKGSGGAGKVLVCFDEKKYLSDNVW